MGGVTKVVIESDTKGRISISALDDEGLGTGHRLAGPKFTSGGGRPLATAVLDDEDVRSIRGYLRDWDELHLTGHVAPAVLALSGAVDRYLGHRAGQVRFPEYVGEPINVQRSERLRGELLDAIKAAGAVLAAPAEPTTS